MSTVKVGTKVRFNPFRGIRLSGFVPNQDLVTGTVIELHEDHNWFAVEYELGNEKLRTSFNYADIGETVKLCK